MNRPEELTGIIDMGTNTFHLLIAKNSCPPFQILHSSKQDVRFGKGGISKNIISADALLRAEDALLNFTKISNEYGIMPHAFATSALRNAKNKQQVVKTLESKTGVKINVVDGNEEATFISYGVQAALPNNDQSKLIMDIGGGSVEFIITEQNQVTWKKSFEIGIQRVKDLINPDDPISSENIVAVNDLLDSKLASLRQAISTYSPDLFVGCAGTFDTICDVYEKRVKLDSSEAEPIGQFDQSYFQPLYSEMVAKTYSERLNDYELAPLRAEMIALALSMVRWVLDLKSFQNIIISRYAMKEGILYKSLNCI